MEKISIWIVDLLQSRKYIEESKHSIYQYGMQMALEIICSLTASCIICYLLGTVVEGVIFFAAFIPLRSYLGGFHLKSYLGCWICSCVTLTGILILTKYIEPSIYISWLTFAFFAVIILFEAKGDGDEDSMFFQKNIYWILFLETIVSIIFVIVGDNQKIFLVACTNGLVALSKILEKIIHVKWNKED